MLACLANIYGITSRTTEFTNLFHIPRQFPLLIYIFSCLSAQLFDSQRAVVIIIQKSVGGRKTKTGVIGAECVSSCHEESSA